MLNRNGYIRSLRESRTFKGISVLVALSIVTELVHPSLALALTEGPSQPEVQSFEPVNTTEMVDLFSGDFNYNIPLFNLPGPNGGYPVNLAYHAGVSMDDEASWVGLGWNINVGALVRNMRGLPDEFLSELDGETPKDDADHLLVKHDMKQNWTLGTNMGLGFEAIGGEPSPSESINFGLYYNNYRGMGTSVGFSAGLGDADCSNYSLGLSLDSENGLGVSANVGYDRNEGVHQRVGLSLNFNGNLSVEFSLSESTIASVKQNGGPAKISEVGHSISSSMSFANTAYSPSITNKLNNYNISGSITIGGEAWPTTVKPSFGFNFTTQDMSDEDKAGRKIPVMGYERAGEAPSNQRLYTHDFMRQNDGQLTKESIMLSNAYYTYDTYSSSGQGLIGFFRAKRNDIGRVYDPYRKNASAGLNLAFEIAVGSGTHPGFDLGVNFGWDSVGPWDEGSVGGNSLDFDFLNPTDERGLREVVYYQAHGEQTIMEDDDYAWLDGFSLPTIKLVDGENDGLAYGDREINSASVIFNNAGHSSTHRYARNTLVHSFLNKEVGNLGEFDVRYYDAPYATQTMLESDPSSGNMLDREERALVDISNHKAGYKVTNADGTYYVYGLPAYNVVDIANSFSVAPSQNDVYNIPISTSGTEVDYKLDNASLSDRENSHKYIHKTSMTPYAHSFLLTSVLGADYVDRSNDGPTDDDLGYWVKFDYLKQSDDFKWRAPYAKDVAMYQRGMNYHGDDDMGSYHYGEKEQWFLGRIETKTHIAIFITEPRDDARAAECEHVGYTGGTPEQNLRLKEIQVYEKSALGSNKPIQKIKFDYGYDLCKGVPNNLDNVSNPGTAGKLTLKKVSFFSQNSSRETAYSFDYAGLNLLGLAQGQPSGINPDYETNAFDGWGTYRKRNSALFDNNFPYTTQFYQSWNSELATLYQSKSAQEINDEFASAWCLNKIKLPSGGVINIEYESDDYGYVQHKTACQMLKIVGLGHYPTDPESVYDDEDVYYNEQSTADEDLRRVYFRLEEPLTSITAQDQADEVYRKYIEPLIPNENGERNLFFKVRMQMTENVWEFVSGYLPIEENTAIGSYYKFGVSSDPGVGFLTIKPALKKNGQDYFEDYHPMALAGWTFMQTDMQEVLNNPNSFGSEEIDENNIAGKVVDLLNFLPQLSSSFGAIRVYCKSRWMCSEIDKDYSCIRLASPDKKKFGGGHRVKEISMTDGWGASGAAAVGREYGQHFKYTTSGNGQEISSGVATFEPAANTAENPLCYPIYFYGKNSLWTSNNLFAEAPVNRDLFPGPSVGYSKVTVSSLNTHKQIEDPSFGQGRTGGVTVHEFYTAKEFPTITSYSQLAEENNTKDAFDLPIPIPFIGKIERHYFHGTQAFMIETNDMHGKPKAVRTYEIRSDYTINPNPISEVSYEYQCESINYQGEQVKKLNSEVDVIENNDVHNPVGGKMMGVEIDLFTDQRKTKYFYQSLGVAINFDILNATPPIPLPGVWVSMSNTKTKMKTYTTNKVIHRSGILKRTITRDLQSTEEMEILAYDERAGTPVLVKTTNEFGDEFFNYSIPAYYKYENMGHGYRNIDYRFLGNVTEVIPNTGPNGGVYVHFVPNNNPNGNPFDNLVRGDEVLLVGGYSSFLSLQNQLLSSSYKKGYFLGFEYDANGKTRGIMHFLDNISLSDFNAIMYEGEQITQLADAVLEFKVIRSGRRNHYTSAAANYVTKGQLSLASGTETLATVNSYDIETPKINANTVLSASASLFRDDWASNELEEGGMSVVDNPYLEGRSGIWRPYKSYTYVGPRKSTMGTDFSIAPDLKEDGVLVDEIPMFSWDIGHMEDYVSNWEWVNEITRYSSDSYELENKNRLDIYSSALYGYKNSLPIAVGGNAGYFELGAIDFELANTSAAWAFGESLRETNLNFHNSTNGASEWMVSEVHKIEVANFGGANTVAVNTNILYNDWWTGNYEPIVGLSLNSVRSANNPGNSTAYLNGNVVGVGWYTNPSDGLNYAILQINPSLCQFNGQTHLPYNSDYTGHLRLLRSRPVDDAMNASESVSFSSERAHTGKKSMKVSSQTTFDQPKMVFVADKKYILSTWISRTNDNVTTFEAGSPIQLGTMSGSSFTALTNTVVKYGKVVEGWQKVDIEFSLSNSASVLGIRINPGGSPLFVDDLRVSPKTGGITTYVYDPAKFWLRATLNVDNYATLYYYDEEGKLTLKKQETEEGIFTTTESRSHVKN